MWPVSFQWIIQKVHSSFRDLVFSSITTKRMISKCGHFACSWFMWGLSDMWVRMPYHSVHVTLIKEALCGGRGGVQRSSLCETCALIKTHSARTKTRQTASWTAHNKHRGRCGVRDSVVPPVGSDFFAAGVLSAGGHLLRRSSVSSLHPGSMLMRGRIQRCHPTHPISWSPQSAVWPTGMPCRYIRPVVRLCADSSSTQHPSDLKNRRVVSHGVTQPLLTEIIFPSSQEDVTTISQHTAECEDCPKWHNSQLRYAGDR